MNKLVLWRGKRGLTVRELADKSKVGPSTISQLEKGHRKAYISTIGKLANALDVDIDELLDLVQQDTPSPETTEEETPQQLASVT